MERDEGPGVAVVLPPPYGAIGPKGERTYCRALPELEEAASGCLRSLLEGGRLTEHGAVAATAFEVAGVLLAFTPPKPGRRARVTTAAERNAAGAHGLATVACIDPRLVEGCGFGAWLAPGVLEVRPDAMADYCYHLDTRTPEYGAIMAAMGFTRIAPATGLRHAGSNPGPGGGARAARWEAAWEAKQRLYNDVDDPSLREHMAAADFIYPILRSDKGLIVLKDGTLAPNYGAAVDAGAPNTLAGNAHTYQSGLGVDDEAMGGGVLASVPSREQGPAHAPDNSDELVAMLQRLDAQERLIVTFWDRTDEEIAGRVGCTPQWIGRQRKKIKEKARRHA